MGKAKVWRGLLAVALVVPASATLAAEMMTGPFISAAGGFRASTVRGSISQPSVPLSTSIDLGRTSFAGNFAGGYSFDVSGFNIAVGAFYELGEKKVAEGSITTGAGSSSFTINQKGRFGAFVAPGAFIGSNTILYAKLSYNRAPGDISIANGGTSRTENFNGIGGGFGIKHLFGPNVFMFIEIEYIAYQSKNFSLGGQDSVTYKPKNAVGLLGVGYQF